MVFGIINAESAINCRRLNHPVDNVACIARWYLQKTANAKDLDAHNRSTQLLLARVSALDKKVSLGAFLRLL